MVIRNDSYLVKMAYRLGFDDCLRQDSDFCFHQNKTVVYKDFEAFSYEWKTDTQSVSTY